MLEEKIKGKWGGARPNTGGARPGAGRKKKENKKPSYRISFRLDEEENKLLEEAAKKEGLSIGQYARKYALEKAQI